MPLAKATIDLEARLVNIEQSMAQAARLGEQTASRIDRGFAAAAASVKGNIAALVASVTVGAGIRWAGELIDGLDALNDASDATGVTVDRISALEDVALRTGGNLDTVETALVKLNAALKEAAPGSAQEDALKAIGLSAKELRAMDPAAALQAVAQAYASYADDGSKARHMQELLGKSARELAPFLKDLAESGQLNATVTAAQAAEAEKFNKHMASLRTNVQQAGRAIMTDLLPQLSALVEGFNNGTSGSLLDGILGTNPVARMRSQSEAIAAEIALTTDRVVHLQEMLTRDPGNALLAGPIDKARARIAALQQQAQKLNAQLVSYANLTDGGPQAAAQDEPAKPAIREAADTKKHLQKAAAAWTDYSDEVTQAIAKMAEQSDTVQLANLDAQLTKLQTLSAAGLDPKITDDVWRLIQAARTKITGQITVELPPAEAAKIDAYVKRLDEVRKIMADTTAGKLQDLERQLAGVNEAWEQGDITAQQYGDAVLMLRGRMDELTSAGKQAADELSSYWDEAQRSIQGTLSSTIDDTLAGNFDDLGTRWRDTLRGMVADALAADLAEAAFGNKKTGTTGWLQQGVDWVKGLGSSTAGTAAFGSDVGQGYGGDMPAASFDTSGATAGLDALTAGLSGSSSELDIFQAGMSLLSATDQATAADKAAQALQEAAASSLASQALQALTAATVEATIAMRTAAASSAGSGVIGGHAAGGLVDGLSWVGENGPELAAFGQAARIIPATQSSQLAGGAGMPAQHVSISIDARTDQAQVAALVAQGVQAGNEALVKRLRAQGRI